MLNKLEIEILKLFDDVSIFETELSNSEMAVKFSLRRKFDKMLDDSKSDLFVNTVLKFTKKQWDEAKTDDVVISRLVDRLNWMYRKTTKEVKPIQA